MKRVLQLAAVLLILTSCTLAVDQKALPPLSSLPVGSAVIADLKGEVSARSPQEEVLTLGRGVVLPAETMIEVGKGSLLLNLSDGSEVLLKSHSRVVLKSPATEGGFYLRLLLGKLIARIQKRLGEEPAFRMGTPSAVITVRGTRFQVEVNKQSRTYVEVFEGLVEVSGLPPNNNPPVFLRPGYFTNVPPNHAPSPPKQGYIDDFSNRNGENEGRGEYGPRTVTPGGEGEGEGHEHPDN